MRRGRPPRQILHTRPKTQTCRHASTRNWKISTRLDPHVASNPSSPDASTLRPWQFFTLLALFTATVAVVLVRGTTPSNIILICLAIGAAALVGLGALRTLKPLVSAETYAPEMIGNRTRAALEREKNLLVRAIKELEFDYAMGKVSAADYEDMTSRLRSRAVRLIKQLDSAESGYRELIERELASRLGKAGASSATKVAPYRDQTSVGAAVG